MNKEDFKKQIAKIQTIYNKIFTKNELIIWFEEFQNTSIEDFGNAINKIITTNKFAPKIADIKSKINESTYRYYADDPYAHLYKNNEWSN